MTSLYWVRANVSAVQLWMKCNNLGMLHFLKSRWKFESNYIYIPDLCSCSSSIWTHWNLMEDSLLTCNIWIPVRRLLDCEFATDGWTQIAQRVHAEWGQHQRKSCGWCRNQHVVWSTLVCLKKKTQQIYSWNISIHPTTLFQTEHLV